jgi:hypothetical protein
MELEF